MQRFAVSKPLNHLLKSSKVLSHLNGVDLSGKDCPEQSNTITKNNQAFIEGSAYPYRMGGEPLNCRVVGFAFELRNLIGFTN
jgi:hypothetical protein